MNENDKSKQTRNKRKKEQRKSFEVKPIIPCVTVNRSGTINIRCELWITSQKIQASEEINCKRTMINIFLNILMTYTNAKTSNNGMGH